MDNWAGLLGAAGIMAAEKNATQDLIAQREKELKEIQRTKDQLLETTPVYNTQPLPREKYLLHSVEINECDTLQIIDKKENFCESIAKHIYYLIVNRIEEQKILDTIEIKVSAKDYYENSIGQNIYCWLFFHSKFRELTKEDQEQEEYQCLLKKSMELENQLQSFEKRLFDNKKIKKISFISAIVSTIILLIGFICLIWSFLACSIITSIGGIALFISLVMIGLCVADDRDIKEMQKNNQNI